LVLTSARKASTYVAIRTALLVLFAVGMAGGLATPGSASAKQACWEQVVDDWSDGTIGDVYPVRCYRQALHRLPEDVLLYSSASDDIGRALASRIISTRRPAVTLQHAGSLEVSSGTAPARDGGHTSAPLILAGSLIGLLGILAAAGLAGRRVVRRSRSSPAVEGRDHWTGASS
jgi:hypothetical protein